MAPLTRRQKKALAAAPPPPVIDPSDPVINPADRISRLPEGIQAHILSFLPAQEGVQTCVLARTWRDIWKSTRCLRIMAKSVDEVQQFVDNLLRVRLDGLKVASLDASEISFDPSGEVEDPSLYYLHSKDMPSINGWICRILECRIKMLRIDIDICGSCVGYLEMSNIPLLISRHLTRLELKGIWFACSCLDLDGCHALEHLEITECQLLGVRKIMSRTLKRLIIRDCDSNHYEKRIRITAPRLVSLLLDNTDSPAREDPRTPLLGRMPDLVEAEVWIDSYLDQCKCDNPMACYHVTRDGDTSDIDSDSDDWEEGSCDYAGQNTTKCVLLEGLAEARDLVLIANHPTYIFRRDLRWCPTFSHLKTLVLYDDSWWQADDCSALACILEHAPLLEELTINSYKLSSKFGVKLEGHPDATVELTTMSKHLRTVEINCENVDERILNVLDFLGSLNICFKITATKKVPMKKQPFH